MSVHLRWFCVVLGLVVLLGGCKEEETPVSLGPPAGWQQTGSQWWQVGFDTTGVFRPLDTLEEMGVEGLEITYIANVPLAQQTGVVEQQLTVAVKKSLVRLYRNQPEVIDSLFERFVVPKIKKTNPRGDLRPQIDKFKREGYRTLSRHFREPRTIRKLVSAAPKPSEKLIVVPYPDSLRSQGIEGKVGMQVFLNEKGEPQSIELLEKVHPVLDDIAMGVTTQMRWQPAYVLQGGKARPIPAWARFKVNFVAPPRDGR